MFSLESLDINIVLLPFNDGYAHDSDRWTKGDSLLVCVSCEDGVKGYGETKPKEKLTGENGFAVVQYIEQYIWPSLKGFRFSDLDATCVGLESIKQVHDAIESTLDTQLSAPHKPILSWNSAHCAVEMAILDCMMRRAEISFAQLFPPVVDQFNYCSTITSYLPEDVKRLAEENVKRGVTDFRLKINEHYMNQLQALLEVTGPDIGLHVDANGSFTPATGEKVCNEIYAQYPVQAIEDPIPRGSLEDLKLLKSKTALPLMVDNWIVTLNDGVQLAQAEACDIFYLKVSKCGGVYRTLDIAQQARKNNIDIGLGSHVGESSILSSAGRHIAASLGGVKFLSGSSGDSRLKYDLIVEDIKHAPSGEVGLIEGISFGYSVRTDVIDKYSAYSVSCA